jgi:hypothetical protein
VAGDEFNAPNELGHRCMPALEPSTTWALADVT